MGPVGAEIETFEDPDELGEPLLHLLALAELSLVVEVGLIDHALEQIVVGFSQFAYDYVDSLRRYPLSP